MILFIDEFILSNAYTQQLSLLTTTELLLCQIWTPKEILK